MKKSESSTKKRTQLRREREKEKCRNEIIQAAERFFISQGFENTTMDQIAEEAEYSKGTVYNYFNSKEDLYLAIATLSYKKLNEMFQKAILTSNIGIDQIKSIGLAYIAFTQDYPGYANILHEIGTKIPYSSLIEKAKSKKKLIQNEIEFKTQIEIHRKIFVDIIEKAIENKKIRGDISPTLIATTLSTLTSGLIKELSQRKNFLMSLGIQFEDVLELVFDFICKGLTAKKN